MIVFQTDSVMAMPTLSVSSGLKTSLKNIPWQIPVLAQQSAHQFEGRQCSNTVQQGN